MKSYIGQKISFNLPDGRSVPGLVLSEETITPTEVTNRTTGAKVTVPVTRVDVISQRVSREGVTYRTISSEVVQYGYAPKMLPRFNTVMGLDATEDGEKITLQQAIDSVSTDREAFLNGLYTARHEIIAADAV